MAKVKKIKSESPVHARRVTKSDVTDAYNLHRANRLINALLAKGLVSKSERDQLVYLNVKTYAPHLLSLYEIVDNKSV